MAMVDVEVMSPPVNQPPLGVAFQILYERVGRFIGDGDGTSARAEEIVA
jgi:hypothetical protein